MSKIWRYVLAQDYEFAPCIDGGLLTLCTCKPKIRSGAEVGDWVIAFMPKNFGVGRVVWAGCVKDILSMGDYGAQYAGRADAIYRRVGWFPDGREVLEHYGGPCHNSRKQIETDPRGRHALIFGPYWYWGGNGPVASPKVADLAHYYVGQTTKGSTSEAIECLRDWLWRWPVGIHGAPRDVVAECSGHETGCRARPARVEPSRAPRQRC
jgi:Nucleotide modification associated domain 2